MGKIQTSGNSGPRRPWWKFKTRRPWRPFDSTSGLPDRIRLLQYCRHCTMDVDVEIDEGDCEGTSVYRKRCLRCGRVIAHGVAKTQINDRRRPFNPAVWRFISQRGTDRS